MFLTKYLFRIIPTWNRIYITRNVNNVPLFIVKRILLKNSFFPSTKLEWNKLDLTVRKLKGVASFKEKLQQFVLLSDNSICNCCNLNGIQLFTRLRLGLSHLCGHKFRHNFQDVNPFCNCLEDIPTPCHYLLHYPSTLTKE